MHIFINQNLAHCELHVVSELTSSIMNIYSAIVEFRSLLQ